MTQRQKIYGDFTLTKQESDENNGKTLTVTKNGKEIYTMEITASDDSKGYYADWNNASEGCLRVEIDNYVKGISGRYSYTWYKFDENGNLIEQKEYIENYIYKDEKEYGPYKILITADQKLVVYTPGEVQPGPEGVIVAKLDLKETKERLENLLQLLKQGNVYYADWSDSNSGYLRVRLDNYIEECSSRYSTNWYKIDKNGNLLENEEYIEDYIYKDEKEYGPYKILITSDKKLVVYKPYEIKPGPEGVVVSKFDFYIDKSNIDLVTNQGKGYYADWNNSNEERLRVRIDKYINNNYSNRESYTWYTIDKNGKLLNNVEIKYDAKENQNTINTNSVVNNTVPNTNTNTNTNTNSNTSTNSTEKDKFSNYIFENTYSTAGSAVSTQVDEKNKGEVIKEENLSNFTIDLTSTKKLIIYSNKKVIATFDITMPDEDFNTPDKGRGYYVDWNNCNKKCLRVRIDKYSTETGKPIGCVWYYFDNNGTQITVQEYEAK